MRFKNLFLLVVLILLLSVSCVVSAGPMLNEPDGFRDLTWGTEFSTVENAMTYLRTDESYGGIKFYTRQTDNLTIGAAKLEMIQYGFWQGRFCDVWIYADGYSNWAGVHEALTTRFGQGYKSNRYIEDYLWYGDKTSITSEYNKTLAKGRFHFSSEVISKQQEAWSTQKAKEGAKGF
jgi:hypothetical protein